MSRASRVAPATVTYISYLPGDDDPLDERATEACQALVDALDSALRKTSEAFWAHVQRNGRGLGRSLDTYLQFKTRPFETRGRGAEPSTSVTEDELGRKVFLTMLRLVNDGARERSCLTLEERRQAVLKHNLIDVPKLIDLTVIYGSDNRDLVHEVLENAVKLLPTLEDDFGRTGLMIEKNLKDMAARVTPAAEANELPPDGLSESLSYFHDVAISLVSLVTVYPEAAEWLRRDGNLTGALEKIRSMVLSSFQSMATCDSDSLDTVRGSLGAAISFLRSADGGGGGGGGGGGEPVDAERDKYVGLAPVVVNTIESVRIILPDVGIGFLKACVDHFGPNAESIVQHLFEESLPPDLRSLDRQLGWPPPASKLTWRSRPQPSIPVGKRLNKEADLELSVEDKKRVLKAARNLEYEDEYDDSFDDLPVQVANVTLGTDELEDGDGRKERANASKRVFYVADGKVYHSHKAGAEKIFAHSAEEASTIALAQEKTKRTEIEGLGAGGNKSRFDSAFTPSTSAVPFTPRGLSTSASAKEQPRANGGAGRGGRGSGGRQTRGLTAKDFTHKHHNQKAKAAKKAAL